jgi:crotonobetainyl-CoA:carnitine CoA-transferase CaiB-like acyl-CoA transferase
VTGVLDGIVVLDLSQGIAGPIVGMLLADHGAQVTKIEPPGGDPTRALRRAGVAPRQAERVLRPRRRARS